jgi:hypothetical protein
MYRSISNPPSRDNGVEDSDSIWIYLSANLANTRPFSEQPQLGAGPLLVLSITADPCGALLSHAGAADPSHSRGLNTLIR